MAAAWGRAALVVLAVVAVDQAAKALVVDSLTRGERRDFAFGIDLVHVRNSGIAFGLFDGGGAALTIVTVAALALLLVYFATHARRPLLWLATGLLLGGRAGQPPRSRSRRRRHRLHRPAPVAGLQRRRHRDHRRSDHAPALARAGSRGWRVS
jgi:hypothetical protein